MDPFVVFLNKLGFLKKGNRVIVFTEYIRRRNLNLLVVVVVILPLAAVLVGIDN